MIEAKKRFGQNFLKDTTVLHKIIQAMPKKERDLVEIGPGLGDLTRLLLREKPLRAYEVDRDLCVYLNSEFSKEIKEGRLEIIEGDVLESFEKGSLSEKPYDLVANLPYYIATKIILLALEDSMCKSMIIMVQKEVAQKFATAFESKEFGSLAILAQSIADVEILFDVPPEAFEPRPKVVSSILKIVKKRDYFPKEPQGVFEDREDFERFKKYLKLSFSSPRKTWIKNISSFYDKKLAQNLLNEIDKPSTIRPHQLSVINHHKLYKRLNDARKQFKQTE